ncbi:MAG TPA: GNAT family N-acetyltransferase [Gemmatimonadaceae bacterium]
MKTSASASASAPDSTPRNIAPHPLDRVIWESLTTQHRSFALGDELARRYPAAVAPFAAIADTSTASFESLRNLMTPGDVVVLFTIDDLAPPDEFAVVEHKTIDQMIGPTNGEPRRDTLIARLGPPDFDEIMALIDLTKPGPFRVRTQELGLYLGVRVDGRLAAMAGERMHLDGYTEISAVCSHPDFRGRHYANDLILTLTNAVQTRGETPFLHVLSENQAAISLYRRLGFARRTRIHLTVLRRVA